MDYMKIVKLPTGHFLRHVHHELTVFLIGFAQHSAKLVEVLCILAGAAPTISFGRLSFEKVRQLRRLVAFVEELIERDLESTR
jgi:hypothetical protein